jgi:hypothetical protein
MTESTKHPQRISPEFPQMADKHPSHLGSKSVIPNKTGNYQNPVGWRSV